MPRCDVAAAYSPLAVYAVLVNGVVMVTRAKSNGDLALASFKYFVSHNTPYTPVYLIYSHSDRDGNEVFAEIIARTI